MLPLSRSVTVTNMLLSKKLRKQNLLFKMHRMLGLSLSGGYIVLENASFVYISPPTDGRVRSRDRSVSV